MDFALGWAVNAYSTFLPSVPHQVLEETEQYQVVRCGYGEVVRVLRNTPPPAMPQWLSYPLSSRADWRTFKTKLRIDTPGAGVLPDNLDTLAAQSKERDYPLGMWLGSTFGYIRDLFGVEAVSYLFYDDVALEVLPKLEACFGEGGWIPACDHGIPPDVPFDNYRYYRDLVIAHSS